MSVSTNSWHKEQRVIVPYRTSNQKYIYSRRTFRSLEAKEAWSVCLASETKVSKRTWLLLLRRRWSVKDRLWRGGTFSRSRSSLARRPFFATSRAIHPSSPSLFSSLAKFYISEIYIFSHAIHFNRLSALCIIMLLSFSLSLYIALINTLFFHVFLTKRTEWEKERCSLYGYRISACFAPFDKSLRYRHKVSLASIHVGPIAEL